MAARTQRRNADLNAFLFRDPDAPRRGMRIAVKDNIDVRGMPATAGGRHLPASPRTRDAACVARLRDAGCAIVGKTNLYEYAMGATSRNEHHGDVRNPRDLARDAGGSSSGSAAAVAAGLCDAALGTDTLGSVRIPAAFCGVVGYKPPRSAVPRRGVFPNSRSFDAVGVLAPDARTAARVVDLMRATSLSRVRIAHPSLAVPWAWLDGMSPAVRRAFLAVARELPDAALPALEEYACAFPIVQYESYALHRTWLREAPERYGREVRGLLRGSASVTAARYRRALADAARVRYVTRRALARVDAVILPTVPFVAPRLGRATFPQRRAMSAWTRPFNVSDSAVFSLPLRTSGLPIGLQVVANDEATAIAVASLLEGRLR